MPKADGTPPAGGASSMGKTRQDAPQEGALADEFTDLAEADEYLNAMLYGAEGTGKTTATAFMANLPGDGVVIFINAEAGLKKKPLRALGVQVEKIKIWTPPDGRWTYEVLERLYYRIAAWLADDPGSVKGVVLDSGSEIVNKILEAASAYWYTRDQKNDKKHWSDKRDSPEVTELQDYGLMTSQVRKLLRKFRDLPCHFAVTALETEGAADGYYKPGHAAPEMTPKLRVSALGYVDIAIRLSAESLETGERSSEVLVTARCQRSPLVRVKDRLHVLPRDLPEPRFDRLVAYAEGDVTVENDDVYTLYEATREKSAAWREEKKAARQGKAGE